jgi:hypothetical protein
MQKGDLVRIKHNEHHGEFVLLHDIGRTTVWARIFSLKKREEFIELVRSLEVVNADR